MKRAKPPKKKPAEKKITGETVQTVLDFSLPVYLLAVMDEFHADQEKMQALNYRAKRYFRYLKEGSATRDDVSRLLNKQILK